MDLKIETASNLPLYLQLKHQLEEHIIRDNLKPGTPLPNIKDISSQAGVSLETVYKALNELIKEGKCFRRPKKGTFVGSIPDKRVVQPVLGIYFRGGLKSLENNIIHARLYDSIFKTAEKTGMDVVMITGKFSKSIQPYISSNDFDLKGIILIDCLDLSEISEYARNFPAVRFVQLVYYKQGFENLADNVTGIFSDNFSGVYQLIEHLIGKGHKKIGVLSLDISDDNYNLRIQGYCRALKDNGLHLDKHLILSKPSGNSNQVEYGEKLMGKLYKSNQSVTAVFCVNDNIAKGAINWLNKNRLRQNVEVVGHDRNIPEISRELQFSTIEVKFEKIGEKAVHILNDCNKTWPKIIRINPQLILQN